MPFLCVGGDETSEGVILSGLDVEGVSAGCFCMCVVQPLAFGVLKRSSDSCHNLFKVCSK